MPTIAAAFALKVFIGCLLLAVVFPPLAAGQTYRCLGEEEAIVDALRGYVQELVTAPSWDAELVATREAYHLPATSADDVTVETRRQICQQAAEALHRELYGTEPFVDRDLVVIRVGRGQSTRYIISDRQERVGEFRLTMIFNAKWEHLETFAN